MFIFTKKKYINLLTELMKAVKEELITVKQFIIFIIRLKNEYENYWIKG